MLQSNKHIKPLSQETSTTSTNVGVATLIDNYIIIMISRSGRKQLLRKEGTNHILLYYVDCL